MRKKIILLTIIFLSLFFMSCKDAWYYNIDKYEEVKKKTTYKSFSHLNEPIVFSMSVKDVYALFGYSEKKQFKKECGEVFVIFDWEKEEVYDWVYYPTAGQGYSHGRATEHVYNGKKTYYFTLASGKELAVLDPEKTEVELYPHDIYYGLASYESEGRYLYINSTKNSRPIKVNLYAFDTVEKKFLSPFYYESEETQDQYPITDKNGNVYTVREYKVENSSDTEENKKEYFAEVLKISFENGNPKSEILRTFSENYHYDDNSNEYVRTCLKCRRRIDNYVFIVEEGFGKYVPGDMFVYVYNTETNEFVEKITVNFPKYSTLYEFVKYNDKYYAVLYQCFGDDESGKSPLYFLELEIDNDITTEQYISKPINPNVEDDDSMFNMYMRNSRLYMVENGLNPTWVRILYYDFDTNTMQTREEATVLSLDEIVGIE